MTANFDNIFFCLIGHISEGISYKFPQNRFNSYAHLVHINQLAAPCSFCLEKEVAYYVQDY